MFYDFLLYIFLYFCVVNTAIFFHFKFFIFQCSVRGQAKGRLCRGGGEGGKFSDQRLAIGLSFSAGLGLGKPNTGLDPGETNSGSDVDSAETFQIQLNLGLDIDEIVCLLDSQLWLYDYPEELKNLKPVLRIGNRLSGFRSDFYNKCQSGSGSSPL